MNLSPGGRLGPYEIVGPLGAGGMGEVYRAHDTRLERQVAIKLLPSHLAIDPEARARFEREARAIAAISHPNILAAHDFSTENGTAYLVTELLEGESLRARLNAVAGADERRSGLPVRKAIDIAVQIAQGLAAAHDRHIVHRDLKPDNIFIGTDGHVKILDFGLAVPVAIAGSGSTTRLHTDPATVMGTVGYMAPEQVKGQSTDHRTDIFAFGCVLWELLTGRRAFERATPAETMTAILRDDLPPLAPDDVPLPPALDQIVRHCLEKQPDERFQSARDLTFALRAITGSSPAIPPAIAPSRRRRLDAWRWTVATILLALVTGAAAWWLARRSEAPPPSAPMIRAVLPLDDIATSRLVGKDGATMALSPDGRLLAYVTADYSRIMLRDLTTGQSRTLVSGEGELGAPFFSPDGRFLGYVAGAGGSFRTAIWGALKKIPVRGGAAATLATGLTGLKGADWGDDGWIYYTPSPAFGLWRVSSDGGAPEMLTSPDVARGEKTHRLPFVLPGSRAVLFVVGTARITSFNDARIEVFRLSDRSRHRLVEGGTAPRYLSTGHLLYARGGQLLAIPFDPDRLAVSGVPVTVAEEVEGYTGSGTSDYAVSANGILLYQPRHTSADVNSIVAFDQLGNATKLGDAPFDPSSGRISPDGRKLALDPDGATQQIAIIDLVRNSAQRITFEWDNASPVWTPDGARLVFRSNSGGGLRRLYWQAADGGGVAEALSKSSRDELPSSIYGRSLLYDNIDPKTGSDIWRMSLDDRTAQPFVRTPFDEAEARFSPDGRWVSYQSNQSGKWEVYVQSATSKGGRLQASEGGGVRAIWQPDGRALTYLHGLDLMRVPFADGPEPDLGRPVRLFSLQPDDLLLDVMKDGRFVVMRRAVTQPITTLNLVTNWFDHVRRATQ